MKIDSFRKNAISRIFARTFCILAVLSAALAVWTASAEAFAHYYPECAQEDISPILQKDVLAEADYAILFSQTGLAKPGVDELYASGRQWELLGLQQRFFAGAEVECSHTGLFIRSERLTNFQSIVQNADFLPTAQNGDILITFNGHFFGWRSGHAAIVVDAGKRLTLEAIMPGWDSGICSLEDWQEYPGFALLRLKGASADEREQIAAYAQESLTGLPYSLTVFKGRGEEGAANMGSLGSASLAGNGTEDIDCHEPGYSFGGASLTGSGTEDIDCHEPGYSFSSVSLAGSRTRQERSESHRTSDLSGTQCAHLVWYAYWHFGYDLDSNGGLIVTPSDLYHSNLLEVVQIYGLSPD